MKRLKLKNRFQANATILPNEFIDHYMVSANGEFVKVYLLLLRYLNEPGSVLTVSMIADCLNRMTSFVLSVTGSPPDCSVSRKMRMEVFQESSFCPLIQKMHQRFLRVPLHRN